MNMQSPLVSVILSTYNGNSKWLSESIDSVLNQFYDNFEFIIINDASTNEIEKIILEYQKKENRIIYIKNQENLWLTSSLNKWIEKSIWKYIARIDDDDDWYDQDKLSKQVGFMEDNQDYGMVGTWVIFIDENNVELGRLLNRETDENIRNYISGSNQFTHSSVLIRRSVLGSIWNYIDDKITKYTEDYDLWLRIWKVSKFYNLPEYSVQYRVRGGSISWKKDLQQRINAFFVFQRYGASYPRYLRWFIAHISNIVLPKFIIRYLVAYAK